MQLKKQIKENPVISVYSFCFVLSVSDRKSLENVQTAFKYFTVVAVVDFWKAEYLIYEVNG